MAGGRSTSTWKYFLKRVLFIFPLLFLIMSAVFIMLHFAPGDPALLMLGPEATEEKLMELREELGLNDPLYIQYWDFVKKLVLKGDLGRSYQSGRPVVSEIARTLPVSLQLAVTAMAISVTLSLLIGVISAVRQYSMIDLFAKIFLMIGVSMPVFWLGLVFIVIFSLKLGWFPSSGWGTFRYLVLPAVTLAAYPTASLTRLTRSSMLEVIRQDYIRTARSKGLSEGATIFKHALKNALIPVITMVGVELTVLISGSILTETVFAIPGLGRMTVTAVFARDYAVIRGSVLTVATMVAVINLLVDFSYSCFDPRIRY